MLCDYRHLRVCRLQSDPALEPSHHQQEVIFATDLLRLKGQRNVHPGIAIVGGTRGGHAKDGIQFAAHAELSANNVGIAAEPLLPELVVQDHDVIVSGLRIFRNEMPAQDYLGSKEEVEEAWSYPACPYLFRPLRCRNGEAVPRPRIQRFKDRTLLLPVEIVVRRSVIALAFLVRPDHNDPVAVHIGERRKQHRIEQAENRRGGPNAQGEGQ